MSAASRNRLGVLAAGLLLASALGGQTSPEGWTITRVEVETPVEGAKRLVVHTDIGTLRVRGGKEPVMQLSGGVQKHEDDPRQPKLDLVRDGDTIRAIVGWEDSDDDASPRPDAWNKRRIDLGLQVPAGIDLEVSTVDELLEIRGVEGSTTASSGTGELLLDLAYSTVATTTTGEIRARVSSDSATGSRLETQTGNIVVAFRKGLNFEVEVQTEGTISTDYSLTFATAPASIPKQATARIGDGQGAFEIVSSRGEISLTAISVPASR